MTTTSQDNRDDQKNNDHTTNPHTATTRPVQTETNLLFCVARRYESVIPSQPGALARMSNIERVSR